MSSPAPPFVGVIAGEPVLTLAVQWALLEQDLVNYFPAAALLSMRSVFYAGAEAFQAVLLHGANPATYATEADKQRLNAMILELREAGEQMCAAQRAPR